MSVTNVTTIIGWFFLAMSWLIPFVMRKRNNTFEGRMKSFNVGMLLSAIALVIFVISGVIYYIK